MAITKTAARPAAPLVLLSLAENLRIYLYQHLADTGAMTREQADELVTGESLPPEVLTGLQPGQVQFIQDCQARLR
jgi:hypothetical protein